MAQRIQTIANHLKGEPKSARERIMEKHDDDSFKDMSSSDLLVATLKAAKDSIGVDPSMVDDICIGTVLTPGAPYAGRAAALTAGFPDTTPVEIINRFCSSGLMAVGTIANQIRNGEIEIGLAVGFEDMTNNPDEGAVGLTEETKQHPVAKDCVMPMGWTSENVAGDFNISREKMDKWAAQSHNRAEAAQKSGVFEAEIVPIPTPNGVVSKDDGIRYGTTPEGLAKIKGAFKQWPPSQTTGGNASQITDGGAFVLLTTRRRAKELGLPILAKHVLNVTAGLAPRIMGIGPSVAIPKLLETAHLKPEDVDLYEINEAFSSMMVYCVEKLNLDPAKVNVNGGAVALGHPLGTTGARQIATGFNAIKRTGGKILVTSMCIGLGMGAAGLFVNEQ
ncbi:hypothetical protein A1Q1_06332 [Trichosporon asahii var. asahii CBS 2479]|uniref:3-ketoacyl-CoA thiolase n=1 Tax=Trichosporon asahii var. asahii (strain ATCC 90039 / CBS 2479 / JCM 2466 / KCTC 7840 / NBRC 103889/ NCYC 2677 / UAMH 7654) TaxID=1186058 RepID=J5TQT8_TRIAS|nr:hypothetical protein A1Q1_06332 [Trichosporon asahii var. asahii CBS 2479]EJT52226.1 hypothetical protein A1Q1_06332 [Trichosporon asahii var. asahii CBS 2479]